MGTMKTIFEKIIELLNSQKVNYILKDHPPTRTSEESALHRGEPLKIGAKAMVMKIDTEFIMAVLPADRKIDSIKLKLILNTKNLRFASKEELFEITGLVPGAIPPFGSVFNLPLIVDKALLEEEYMAFNAGSLEKSIKMKTKEYMDVVTPRMEEFSVIK
ncbi:MAG: YbaK/EbsC family protein [Nanoarchaeota archaeon]|nr:YbaK/EbsC family protein [Nanoarchaeota archaeon]